MGVAGTAAAAIDSMVGVMRETSAALHGPAVWKGRELGELALHMPDGSTRAIPVFGAASEGEFLATGMFAGEARALAQRRVTSVGNFAQGVLHDEVAGQFYVTTLHQADGMPLRIDEALVQPQFTTIGATARNQQLVWINGEQQRHGVALRSEQFFDDGLTALGDADPFVSVEARRAARELAGPSGRALIAASGVRPTLAGAQRSSGASAIDALQLEVPLSRSSGMGNVYSTRGASVLMDRDTAHVVDGTLDQAWIAARDMSVSMGRRPIGVMQVHDGAYAIGTVRGHYGTTRLYHGGSHGSREVRIDRDVSLLVDSAGHAGSPRLAFELPSELRPNAGLHGDVDQVTFDADVRAGFLGITDGANVFERGGYEGVQRRVLPSNQSLRDELANARRALHDTAGTLAASQSEWLQAREAVTEAGVLSRRRAAKVEVAARAAVESASSRYRAAEDAVSSAEIRLGHWWQDEATDFSLHPVMEVAGRPVSANDVLAAGVPEGYADILASLEREHAGSETLAGAILQGVDGQLYTGSIPLEASLLERIPKPTHEAIRAITAGGRTVQWPSGAGSAPQRSFQLVSELTTPA